MENCKKAIAAELDGDVSKAFDLYVQAAEELYIVYKNARNKNVRKAAWNKALEIVEKCELLRQCDSKHDAIVRVPTGVAWNDVVGLEEAKNALRQCVEFPSKFPDAFAGANRPWRAILLYGPPGTGKTHLARAAASECNATFFSVSSADIMNKYVGQSEANVRKLFVSARKAAPSLVFIDEIDALCRERTSDDSGVKSRVLTEFLQQMDGLSSSQENVNVIVLGATNIPEMLDDAILRRFELKISVPLPSASGRRALFAKRLPQLTGPELEQLARATPNTSGSDIDNIVRGARLEAFSRIQAATRFVCREDGLYEPCDECNGQEMTLDDVPYNTLAPPRVTFDIVYYMCVPRTSQ